MKRTNILFCYCYVIATMIWFTAVSTRPFAPLASPAPQQEQIFPLLPGASNFGSKQGRRRMGDVFLEEELGLRYRGQSRLGSRPPSCEHKCEGCIPCDAIQIPANTDHKGLEQQYANYEPEGWKCKCGTAFFNP